MASSMPLEKICRSEVFRPGTSLSGIDIVSVEYDSRAVHEGSLFVAVKGFDVDGHRFIDDALARGAAAIVIDSSRGELALELAEKGVTVIESSHSRLALSAASAAFYGHPSRELKVVGVTGTNGKTSVTFMLEHLLTSAGYTTGVIGTVNYRWKNHVEAADHTTPESKDIHELLYRMKNDGVDAVIMEVSSHSLSLNRVDHVHFDGAVFTNLTRDHFDFHENFQNYFLAKKRLFDLLDADSEKDSFGLVNLDDDYGRRIFEQRQRVRYRMAGFGSHEDAYFRVDESSIENRIEGVAYALTSPSAGVKIRLPQAGRFQVQNSLAAFSAAMLLGVPGDEAVKALAECPAIPGRFERFHSDDDVHVVVDYAHTGDALEKLLKSVKEIAPRRVITVFGCGGDRDRQKRPVMGRAAAVLSDVVFVTSDNPRTEDPHAIIDEIIAGIERSDAIIEPDRDRAIAGAIGMAEPDDIVVIAGKGHEDYQILGKEKIHFDDREKAVHYLSLRGRDAG